MSSIDEETIGNSVLKKLEDEINKLTKSEIGERKLIFESNVLLKHLEDMAELFFEFKNNYNSKRSKISQLKEEISHLETDVKKMSINLNINEISEDIKEVGKIFQKNSIEN